MEQIELDLPDFDEAVRIELYGVRLKMAKETLECDGCYGDGNYHQCQRLPRGCHEGDYIWIREQP